MKNELLLGMRKEFLFLIPIFFLSCSANNKNQNKKDLRNHQIASQCLEYVKIVNQQKEDAIDEYINGFSFEEKIGQLFIVNLEGDTEFKPIEKINLINSDNTQSRYLIPGGYLFFSYNIAEEKSIVKKFTSSINDYCLNNGYILPFLAVDQEGGDVCRLRNVISYLPSQKKVGELYSKEEAFELYKNQGKQMHNLGFNLNFAPVTEVLNNNNKDFLGTRSFGDFEKTVSYSKACISAYAENNIGCVIKHFPGNANTDPHTGLPEIDITKKELDGLIEPFSKIIESNPPLGILMSHVRTSAYDSENPACLSSFWVTEKLRKDMNYDGIIFSDDIFMGALKENGYPPEEAVILAINAGIDCIMISEKRFSSPAKVIYNKALDDNSFRMRIDQAVNRIIKYKLSSQLLIMEDNHGIYKIKNNGTINEE